MPTVFSPYFACTALLLALLSAISDTRTGHIPNLLTLPPLAVAPLLHALLGGPGALGGSLLGACLCAVVPGFAFARGAMGGGDLKLFTALGALLGFDLGLQIELAALWLATLWVCGRFAWHGQLFHVLRGTLAFFWQRCTRSTSPAPAALQTELRLGAAIGGATLAVLALDQLTWLRP
jgi:prepilin peptidase CpaA